VGGCPAVDGSVAADRRTASVVRVHGESDRAIPMEARYADTVDVASLGNRDGMEVSSISGLWGCSGRGRGPLAIRSPRTRLRRSPTSETRSGITPARSTSRGRVSSPSLRFHGSRWSSRSESTESSEATFRSATSIDGRYRRRCSRRVRCSSGTDRRRSRFWTPSSSRPARCRLSRRSSGSWRRPDSAQGRAERYGER
jgi:hypothetical protein